MRLKFRKLETRDPDSADREISLRWLRYASVWNAAEPLTASRVASRRRSVGMAVAERSLGSDWRSEPCEKALALVLRETVSLVEAEGRFVA